MNLNRYRKYLILLIPALYLVWSLILNLQGGPFSLSRSDPEYPYLLNGLNCATLNFNNIGHTDHPGTPFQMVTGGFIRITHLLIGQKPLVEDVLSRPDTYLAIASVFLTFLTFLLLYWLGTVAMKTNGRLTGALILQSSLLLGNVLITLPLRYNPDRILVMYNLVLIGLTIKLLFTQNYPVQKYAILTGILMGIGFATKFNFLPVLILPFLLIPDRRNRTIYGLTVIGAFFISVLPILNKFKDFRRFISGVASHDGLYGGGSQQMINWKSFVQNFIDLLIANPAYLVVLLLTLVILILYFFQPAKYQDDKRPFIALMGFVIASVVGFILVSKHFKIYYFAPVLSLTAFAFYLIWRILGNYQGPSKMRGVTRILNHPSLGIVFLVLLTGISLIGFSAQCRSRVETRDANLLTRKFYAGQVTKKDLMFIEPTWMAGPMVENALVYGISYVAHRQQFYSIYQELYPNVITWEGADKVPGHFRTAETDPESLIFCGNDLYIYSSPGRNAGQLINYLDTLAARSGTYLTKDTAFVNPRNEERVIRIRNAENWKTLSEIKAIRDLTPLDEGQPASDSYYFGDVVSGDYLEITLRIKNNDDAARCRIIARSVQSDQDGIYFEDSGSLQDIGHGWQLLRLRGRVKASPLDGNMLCQVYYPGAKTISIQDLNIRHMGRR